MYCHFYPHTSLSVYTSLKCWNHLNNFRTSPLTFITIYLHINSYTCCFFFLTGLSIFIMVEISLDIICSLFYIKTCTNCLINNMQVVLKYIHLEKNHLKSVIKVRAWSSFKTTDGLFPKAQIRCSALGKQQSVSDYSAMAAAPIWYVYVTKNSTFTM